MKGIRLIALFLVALLFSCFTISNLDTPKRDNPTLAYGYFKISNKDCKIIMMSIRSSSQFGLPLYTQMFDNGVFVLQNAMPGRYYIELFDIEIPGLFFRETIRVMFVDLFKKTEKWEFEVKAGQVTSIGSVPCTLTKDPHNDALYGFGVGKPGKDIDMEALKFLTTKAKGTAWEKMLKDYTAKKY